MERDYPTPVKCLECNEIYSTGRPKDRIPEGGPIPLHRDTTISIFYRVYIF